MDSADNLHEISKPIFWEKKKKKNKENTINLLSAKSDQRLVKVKLKKKNYEKLTTSCADYQVVNSGLLMNAWNIVPDKSGYQVNSFLISQWKHMLWVLIRSASLGPF